VLRLAVFAGACLCSAAAAAAEIGATISVVSDARFRGYSISDHHPVALVDLAYDDPSGVYAAASGSTVASPDGVRPLALQLNGGYATRLSSGFTLDLGVAHSEYSRYATVARARSYTEIYAGLSRKYLTGRVYFSPHYFDSNTWTLYGELNGDIGIAPKLSLNGHVGTLVPVRSGGAAEWHPQYDWRLGFARQFGRASVRASWTGGDQLHRYGANGRHSSDALVFGVSLAL
jgi:uncharacterized protein (TIGR02001 family)